MNSDIQTLPTRSEVLALLGRERARISAVYDETGKRVILDGRQAPEKATSEDEYPRAIHCAICDAPAGEVQVVKVQAESIQAKTAAFLSGQATEGYVCAGGRCSDQRTLAILRRVKQTEAVVRRIGAKREGMTGRAYRRRKLARQQTRASRKANR